jgi:hypothetical protein
MGTFRREDKAQSLEPNCVVAGPPRTEVYMYDGWRLCPRHNARWKTTPPQTQAPGAPKTELGDVGIV